MTRWRWYALAAAVGAALLAGAYLTGRAAAPVKVETRTDVVHLGASMEATEWGSATREKVVKGPVRIVTRTVTRPADPGAPAGCPPVQETTVTEERGQVTTERSSESGGATFEAAAQADRETTTKVVEARPRLRLELSQDVTRLTDPRHLGGAVSVRTLGPLWLGVQATADDWKHPRATLAIEF